MHARKGVQRQITRSQTLLCVHADMSGIRGKRNNANAMQEVAEVLVGGAFCGIACQ
jgi:hypothetical protein